MLPTLGGRIQTRLVLLAVVGGIVTLIIGPLLPISAPVGGGRARVSDAAVVVDLGAQRPDDQHVDRDHGQ